MEESRELAQRVAREIEALSKTSPTPPGRTESTPRRSAELVEAINQVFALFRLNYHNQYYAAYSDARQLNQIKKLWLDSLHEYPAAQLLQGARLAIESSDYLPTLNRMRRCCEEALAALGLPAAREAYFEACNAGKPAEAQRWSHPVVYWSGQDCGWTFLASTSESQSWSVFSGHYQSRCAAVLRGDSLPEIPQPAADRLTAQPLPADEAVEHIRRMRVDNDL